MLLRKAFRRAASFKHLSGKVVDYLNNDLLKLMDIRGTIIAIGGNEDKGIKSRKPLHVLETDLQFASSGILCRILAELDSPESGVDIITSASSVPEKLGKVYLRAFRKLGHKNIKILNPTNKVEADSPQILERISNSACIMFSGGDQFKLVSILRGTRFVNLLTERYHQENLVVAGTSAGSMALSDLMIYPGKDPKDTGKNVTVYEGLSLIRNMIIDTHFLVRSRFRRLAVAVASHRGYLGIGLEEDTGIIIREGKKIEAIGSGLVTLFDAQAVRHNNPDYSKSGQQIFIENLLVHILSNGNHYLLNPFYES